MLNLKKLKKVFFKNLADKKAENLIKSKINDTHQLALQARKKLCSLISNKLDNIDINITRKDLRTILNNDIFLLQIKCGEFDKYGRLLVDITIDGTRVDEWLITNGYAKKYDGGTKEKWF